MKHIGLLVVKEEDDILERTLTYNALQVDAFYALDGTKDNAESKQIITSHPKCAGYWTDGEIGAAPCDGCRKHLLEHAYADHGHDNWFLLLHADEVWTHDVRSFTSRMGFAANAFIYQLPFFFPRADDGWDDEVHPLDQLHWHLGPGWPEVRLFRGGPNVHYDLGQHFNVTPAGVNVFATADAPIYHYPYRSPDTQFTRADCSWDPDNYAHVRAGDVFWTDEMIEQWQQNPRFANLRTLNDAPVAA